MWVLTFIRNDHMTFILSSVHMMKFINSHKEFWSPRNTATSEYKSPCRPDLWPQQGKERVAWIEKVALTYIHYHV